jgi:hypothetical protein
MGMVAVFIDVSALLSNAISALAKVAISFSVATGRDCQPQVSTAKLRLLGLLPCFCPRAQDKRPDQSCKTA